MSDIDCVSDTSEVTDTTATTTATTTAATEPAATETSEMKIGGITFVQCITGTSAVSPTGSATNDGMFTSSTYKGKGY